jgi:hypothetical protein
MVACFRGYGALPSFGGYVTSVIHGRVRLAGYATGEREHGITTTVREVQREKAVF